MNDPAVLTTRLLDALEVPLARRGDVRFSSAGVTLGDARFDVATFAAACVAAAYVSAGGGKAVEVDVREAAEAFRSERYLSIGEQLPAAGWAPLSADYPDRAGRPLRIHANFPHHAAAAACALDAAEEPEAFRSAVERGDAFELEEAIVAAGGAAAALRSPAEWRRHPQHVRLAGQPLVRFTRLNDAPPSTNDHPLRVLDLTRVIAGPVAGRVLALSGADVLAVTARSLPQIDALVIETGFGKRSTFLDLRAARDAATFRELIASADVLLESYRPGALERLGLGAADCAALNPNIAYVSISAYGDGGPWGPRRGFDSLVQMATGIAMGRDAFATPAPLPVQALDHGTGWLAAAAALRTAERTRRSGGAWHVTLSLARTAELLVTLRVSPDARAFDPGAAVRLGTMESAFGTLHHALPPGSIAGRPLTYTSAPPALGSDPPDWR